MISLHDVRPAPAKADNFNNNQMYEAYNYKRVTDDDRKTDVVWCHAIRTTALRDVRT